MMSMAMIAMVMVVKLFSKEESWPEWARPATCVTIALTALVSLFSWMKHCSPYITSVVRHWGVEIMYSAQRKNANCFQFYFFPFISDSLLPRLLWQVLE